MSRVYEIADQFVGRLAALNPVVATMLGVPGHDHEMTDYSPDGSAAANDLAKDTLSQLAKAPVGGERDRIATEAMRESLSLDIERYDAGEHLRSISVLTSPIHSIRMSFDLAPRATEQDWANIAARLRLVPEGLASFRRSLDEGVRRGLVVARRQAAGCASQIGVWGGKGKEPPFFSKLVPAYDEAAIGSSALRRDLESAADSATASLAEMGDYLQQVYLRKTTEKDPVGVDRYRLNAREYNGIDLDLKETYAWGWDQLAWVEDEMRSTAERILPGASLEEAKQLLESDDSRSITGVDRFQRWMQDLQDRTISDLDGTHFDLAEPVKHIQAMIAPPGGALAMYYTGPSEDFSRPGRTWYPTGGKTRFPLWGEVSIAYHEGVPGHHFQIATTRHLKDALSRFQRLVGGTSGYAEGWALYAERLMAELGYLQNPDYYLGMLRAQALRSVRVIVDIGMHLELATPANQSFHPSETWTPELGLEFVLERSHFPADFVASEVDRYLGVPGQAISYKVGERVWLEAREASKSRHGPAFDLRAWHTRALDLGPMGLAQMKREMSRV